MVVDTALFQRMRHIKQLGVCSLVFPGAKHDRQGVAGSGALAKGGWRRPDSETKTNTSRLPKLSAGFVGMV